MENIIIIAIVAAIVIAICIYLYKEKKKAQPASAVPMQKNAAVNAEIKACSFKDGGFSSAVFFIGLPCIILHCTQFCDIIINTNP